jgi:hypothetical protein
MGPIVQEKREWRDVMMGDIGDEVMHGDRKWADAERGTSPGCTAEEIPQGG